MVEPEINYLILYSRLVHLLLPSNFPLPPYLQNHLVTFSGDVILSIDGTNMEDADHVALVEFIRNCSSTMR